MTFFQELQLRAQEVQVQFLVIGGLAVNFYGVSRETADLDILVCRDHRDCWCDLLAGLGYSVLTQTNAFIQFSPPSQGAWPVDLMLVAASTWEKMLSSSNTAMMYGTELKIPKLQHLLALKLHALANSNPGRFLKDYMDVENLLRANELHVHSEDVRMLVLKYATPEIYEKLRSTSD